MGLCNTSSRQAGEQVLSECAQVFRQIDYSQVDELVGEILSADKVFFVGVGRVLLSLQAFAKRLNHLGIRAHCVGDINEPAITKNDLLVVGSGSGQTLFPLTIAKKAKTFGARVAHIGSAVQSDLTPLRDLFVRIPSQSRANLADEVRSAQPMTSLFEQCLLLLADTVSLVIVRQKQMDMAALWQYHANLE